MLTTPGGSQVGPSCHCWECPVVQGRLCEAEPGCYLLHLCKAGHLPGKLAAFILHSMFRNGFHSLRFPGKPLTGALNLDLHTCIPSPSLTEPSPQSLKSQGSLKFQKTPFLWGELALLDALANPFDVCSVIGRQCCLFLSLALF